MRILLAALLTVVAGCSFQSTRDGAPRRDKAPVAVSRTPQPEPRSGSGNPRFYDIGSQRYYVMDNAIGYRERGVASWYGKKFHGRATSSGETYDMHAVSAAHKTLPLPTWVRVTNLGNGKSLVLRVNDRGPFVDNRLIDLSYAAARELDLINAGTGLVEVEAINFDPDTTASAPPRDTDGPAKPEPLFMQVGAFADAGNANRRQATLSRQGIENVFIRSSQSDDTTIHRVRIGPIATVAQYDQVLLELADLGIPDARLVTDEAHPQGAGN